MEKMEMLFNYLQAHRMLALVAFVIIFDLFLGVMRSFKEKKTNSTIGIDGMIRKVSMIACLLFLVVLDFLIHLDLIAWLPSQILDILKQSVSPQLELVMCLLYYLLFLNC